MTPLSTINLLRLLFVIASGVVGAMIGEQRFGSLGLGVATALVSAWGWCSWTACSTA